VRLIANALPILAASRLLQDVGGRSAVVALIFGLRGGQGAEHASTSRSVSPGRRGGQRFPHRRPPALLNLANRREAATLRRRPDGRHTRQSEYSLGGRSDADPVFRQLGPHRLDYEVDERSWRVKIEFPFRIAADESFHALRLGPGG
jgi:hypothetical protein